MNENDNLKILKNLKNLKSFKKIFEIKPYGKIKAYTNDYITTFFEKNQMWESEIYDIYRRDIKKNSSVIDCGAFNGCHSLLMANTENVDVYSFEPTYETYKLLLDNITLNNKFNIIPFNNAVSDENNILNIPVIRLVPRTKLNNYGGNMVINDSDISTTKVYSIKLDDLDYKKPISFIKIDVEGYENKVINGAKRIIEKYKPNLLVEIWKDKIEDFDFDYFKLLGYKCDELKHSNFYFYTTDN
jgi:FkbM family methyltransferase